MKDFRQLNVWQKAHRVALGIYKLTREYPKDELYGLTSQMRRSSVSIMQTLLRVVGERPMLTLLDFFRTHLVPRTSLNTFCCSHLI